MLLDMQIYMPSQNEVAQDDFAFTPRSVKSWIKALPISDFETASSQLYDIISKANRTNVVSKQRLAAMEVLQPLTHNLINELRKYLACQSVPLQARSKKIYELQQKLYEELAISYKIIILDVAQNEVKMDNKNLLQCILHAMHYLSNQYTAGIHMYQQLSDNLWHEICQLYRFAEHENLHKATNKSFDQESVENVFKHLCALTLISFNNLRQGEAEKVSKYLKSHIDLIDVDDSVANIDNEFIYVANLATGKQPTYYISRELPISSENRFINYAPLVNDLQEAADHPLQPYSYYLKSGELEPELAQRLLKMIGSPAKRSNTRIASKQTVKAILGLSEVVQFDNPKQEPDTSESDSNYLSYTNLTLIPTEQTITEHRPATFQTQPQEDFNDLWNPFSQPQDNTSTQPEEAPVQSNDNISDCRVMNYSSDGFCLYHDEETVCNTRVGDIIGIQIKHKKNNQSRLAIGVTRWIQGLPEQAYKTGIELFPADHASVYAYSSDNNQEAIPAILLKEICEDKKIYSLVLPTKHNFSSETVLLSGAKSDRAVLLGDKIEATSSFSRVAVKKIFNKPVEH